MRFSILYLLIFLSFQLNAQFSPADSLRGMLRPERTCYNVNFYELKVDLDFKKKYIQGYTEVHYKVVRGFNMLQLDLFANMKIDSVVHQGKTVDFHRKGNAFFVDLGEMQEEGKQDQLCVYFQGQPRIAVNAPWDGGFSWKQDPQGNPWLGVSCEGIGASLWWPNKDHLSDEPDSMRIICTVPKGLTCIANGQLKAQATKGKRTTFDWFVSYPINNYNVTLNVANYVHFSDTFTSPTDGSQLPMDYYVLPYNLKRAKKQFKEAHEVLRIFEKHLDKYPFWKDGYALVETPYLGMEHQGAIAYGNKFLPGYLGRHPAGMPDDFIILHETGHEWWGNSVSCNDHGEMWLHETFCTYMEAVFMEEKYSYEDAVRYLKFYSSYIANEQPMLGPLNVNYDEHDSDMYYKGALMLHTLRLAIEDDELWWDLLKSFYQNNTHNNVVTEDYIKLVEEKTGKNWDYFFNQYLKHSDIPKLQLRVNSKRKKTTFEYKWLADVKEFKLPVFIETKEGKIKLDPNTTDWQSISIPTKSLKDKNFIQPEFGLFELELHN